MKEKLPPLHVLFPPMKRTANPAKRADGPGGASDAQVRPESADRSPLPFSSYGARVKLIDRIKLALSQDRPDRRSEPSTLSPVELHRLYANTPVPLHRYLSAALAEAVNSPEIAPHPSKWIDGIRGIDLSKVVDAWLNTNRNTEYEQLYCIGLDPDNGQLTGLLTVKRGSGYSGGPRTAGSREFVAFWVDWGLGFEYEGTTSVTVHDFGWLPSAGLQYKVSLPVDLLSRMRSSGASRETVKIRAVLSWNTPPSTADPNAPVVWGDVMECRIPIPANKETRAAKHLARFAGTDTAESEIDETGIDGQIVDAAIRALKGTSFGSSAGLTVAPDGAIANSGVTDRSFTIRPHDIQDGGTTFALHVWNSKGISHDETSNLDRSLAGPSSREES